MEVRSQSCQENLWLQQEPLYAVKELVMANPEHLAILKQGGQAWNSWRLQNRQVFPDLSAADLNSRNLSQGDFQNTDLAMANLRQADLTNANLQEASLIGAELV